jgi:hypothetical protein
MQSVNEIAEPIKKKEIQWDRLTAIMAVLIGACALAVSFYTARLQGAQVRAQTWPYLSKWYSNVDYSYSISNRGVGPARIMDVKLFVDKKEMSNFEEAFVQLGRKDAPSTLQSYFARRVLAVNEDVAYLKFQNAEDFALFDQNRERIKFEVCYCSVLSECYLLNENAASEAEYITEVSKCPVDTPGKFQ